MNIVVSQVINRRFLQSHHLRAIKGIVKTYQIFCLLFGVYLFIYYLFIYLFIDAFAEIRVFATK